MNPESLVIKKDSKTWSHTAKSLKVDDRFQFERVGYFVVNEKLDLKNNRIEFNRTVELKESKDKTTTE